MGYFRRDIKSWPKKNSSPVTEADFLVDEFLRQTLLAARPQYGWLSEETTDDLTRLNRQTIFVVDPIDGTRGFIRGDDGWSISLAIVKNGMAIAGVIYVPARDELYEATKGGGAKLNSIPLQLPCKTRDHMVIAASEAVYKKLKNANLEFERAPHMPSLAHRLVQVSTGKIDVAVGRRGAQDWDIAAAKIILGECGIDLEDACLGEPVFNRKETRHGALAAMLDNSLRAVVNEALVDVYGCLGNDADKKA